MTLRKTKPSQRRRGDGSAAGLPINWRAFGLALLGLALGGCDTLRYYAQSVEGQRALLALRRPIPEVIADPATPPARVEQLRQAQRLRAFAVAQLALPVGGSYLHFADVRRAALVWSLVAAPEFALAPKSWCYPVIGCASYRGYFDLTAAEDYAAQLRAEGWDVAVEAVPAYSTLGWFADPVPSTVIDWPTVELAELLFHELAHRRVYAPGDSAFNEAYASVVAQAGVARWLSEHGGPVSRADWERLQVEERRFEALLQGLRDELSELYAEDLPTPERRRAKAEAFGRFRENYRAARAAGLLRGYDGWFRRELNNAHLASVATYRRWVPALERLLADCDGNLVQFHLEAERLAALPQPDREARLAALR